MLLLDPSLAPDLVAEVQRIAQSLSYMGPFLGLLLCGLGLPLPEEVFLLSAGILLYKGEVEFIPITLLCSLAILLGDSLPFLLGRRYGMRALEIPWVARVLHPERFQRFRRRFDAHGNWAVFASRFLPMLRIPGYFVAGTMGMRWERMLLLDSLGVLVSVPISIYLGRVLGSQVDRLKHTVHDLHLILTVIVCALVLVLVIRGRWARATASSRSGPPDGPPKSGG
jgi:membrane protein DedA with SNARE-associated domain